MSEASPQERRDAEHKVAVLARYGLEIGRFRTFKQEAAVDARRKGLLRRLHAKAYRTRPDAPDWEQLTRWRRWRRSSSVDPTDRPHGGVGEERDVVALQHVPPLSRRRPPDAPHHRR